MKSRAVADTDGAATAIPLEMVQGELGDVGVASDGEHDGQAAIWSPRVDESLHDELHVGVGLGLEAEAEKNVDGEARVSDPGVAVVPVPHAADGLGDGKGGRCDDCAGGFCKESALIQVGERWKLLGIDTVCHHLEDHQAPRHYLSPSALVLGLRDEVVPEGLGIVLLGIQDLCGDVFGDVIADVVSDDKGDGLALVDLNASNKTLAEGSGAHLLLEGDDRAAGLLVSLLERNIELELDVLAVEGSNLAPGVRWCVTLLVEDGFVRIPSVVERGEDFNIWPCQLHLSLSQSI